MYRGIPVSTDHNLARWGMKVENIRTVTGL